MQYRNASGRIFIVAFIFLFGLIPVLAKDFVFKSIDVMHGLSDNQIRYILQLPDGRMVFTTSGNVNLYDGNSFKYIHRNSQHIYSLDKYHGHYRVYYNGDSLLWIKDQHKLSCLNLRQEQYIFNIDELFRNQGITEPVEDLFLDDLHRIWLLTGEKLIQCHTSETIHTDISLGELQDVLADHENVYLFYCTGIVVCYFIETKQERYRKAAYPAHEQGLFKNTSLVVKGKNGFYQLRNGSKGGFFFFDPTNCKWEKILETEYTLNTLILTPDDNAYISCPQGFWIVNPLSKEKQYLPELKTTDGTIIDTEISTLFYDKQGGLWLGTLNRGLLYYHPSRYKFMRIGRSYMHQESSRDIIALAFAESNNRTIYVRFQSGIYEYCPSNESNKNLIPVSPASLTKEVLSLLYQNPLQEHNNPNYTAMLTDSRGWTWAGTPDGLKLFQPETSEERILYTEDGLSNNFVHALKEDRNHHIWVTTSYGISQIRVDSLDHSLYIINYNAFDGTLEGEYADGAIYEAMDGTLFFGGINGFNVLKPSHEPVVPLPFKPVFTNLYIRGEIVKPGKAYEGRIVLNEATPYTQSIELSYQQNFLTLEYSAINYQNPHQTLYRYQMEGIDADWHEITSSEQLRSQYMGGLLQVSYTNLPAGRYMFKVMASNSKNQWNGEISALKITIHAPWWKTTKAFVAYLVLLSLVLFFAIAMYLRISHHRLEREHKEEILFLRIRNLIEQVNQLEAEKESYLTNPVNASRPLIDHDISHSSDNLFLANAIEQVEKNLNAPGYSVEQLSRDLCMDRTGLYRKLITLLDKSPSLFIRHIRIQKAAQLILEGQLSITEIAEKVGFSSSSYLSKCFQETYGCRPSDYVEKMRKST